MWEWLRPGGPTRRFLPASAIGAAAILYATGRPFDIFAIGTALVLVPMTAFALNLLYRPIMRSLAIPVRAASRMAERMVKKLSKHGKLAEAHRQRLREALLKSYRPLVLEQSDEFWVNRDRDPSLDEKLQRHEVSILSLGFLTIASTASVFILLFNLSGGSSSIPASIPGLVSVALAIVAFAFFLASRNELRAYRRLLWDRVPLLMVLNRSFDSNFWKRRVEFIEAKRKGLGDDITDQMLSAAHEKRELALRGEVEREWIETRVAQEIGEDLSTVRALLGAVSSALKDATVMPARQVSLALILASGLITIIIASYISPSSVAPALTQVLAPLLGFGLILALFVRYVVFRRRANKLFIEVVSKLEERLKD